MLQLTAIEKNDVRGNSVGREMQKLRQRSAVNFILFYGIIELIFLSAEKTLRPFLLFGAAENPAAVILALQYKNAFLMEEQNIQLGRRSK